MRHDIGGGFPGALMGRVALPLHEILSGRGGPTVIEDGLDFEYRRWDRDGGDRAFGGRSDGILRGNIGVTGFPGDHLV